MHKVALSPHVISVWIKMDYWITRASHQGGDRQTETKEDGKPKRAEYRNVLLDLNIAL